MNTITITLQQIKDCNLNAERLNELLAFIGKEEVDNEHFPLADVLDLNGMHDTICCFRALPEHNKMWAKFAWWSAKGVEHKIQDQRSIDCLEVLERYLQGKATNDELYAARASSAAAAAVALADSAVCNAAAAVALADSAVWNAAAAADYAADAVCDAAYVFSYSTYADAAAAIVAQETQLRKILDAGEWVD